MKLLAGQIRDKHRDASGGDQFLMLIRNVHVPNLSGSSDVNGLRLSKKHDTRASDGQVVGRDLDAKRILVFRVEKEIGAETTHRFDQN